MEKRDIKENEVSKLITDEKKEETEGWGCEKE